MKFSKPNIKHNRVKLSLSELITRFEFSNRSEGKSERTTLWYNEILNLFICYLRRIGYPDILSSFTIQVVREYIIYLRQKSKYDNHPRIPKQDVPLSPQTLRCHTRVLKVFSTWLHHERLTKENRLRLLKLPKASVPIIEPLSTNEIELIISAINKKSPTGIRNLAILELMLDSGLRTSEFVKILLSEINLGDGYIKVIGKGSKQRITPLGKHTQKTLLYYIDNMRPQPFQIDGNYLFLSRNGKPITANIIKLMFSRLAKKSGINRLHAHLCRHTFCINYLLNGGDVFSLKEILGHSTLEMVNNYLHFTSLQIIEQHHRYSPMDKMYNEKIIKGNNSTIHRHSKGPKG